MSSTNLSQKDSKAKNVATNLKDADDLNKTKNHKKKKTKRSESETEIKSKSGGGSFVSNSLISSRSAGATDIESTFSGHHEQSEEGAGATLEDKTRQKETEIVLEPSEYIKHWKRQAYATRQYGYLSLFRFSKPLDKLYILVGLIAAVIGGICVPILVTIFGNMVRSMVLVSRIRHSLECMANNTKSTSSILGNASTCTHFVNHCLREKPFKLLKFDTSVLNEKTLQVMNEFSLWFGITSLIFTICSSVYFICWHMAGDNQIVRIRKQYFEALLRKDKTWFDTQRDPDSVNKLMDHTKGIWIGIGENIPIAVNIFTTCVLSLIVAVSHGWELTSLCLIAVILLVLTTCLVTWANSHKLVAELEAYKTANIVAEETLKNIRTVMFFGGQKKELLRYKKKLGINSHLVRKWICVHSGCVFAFWTLNFLIWAVIFWFAIALVIRDHSCKDYTNYETYDAGDVIIIIFCIVFGTGNIYMIVPVMSAIRVAKGYGRKVFKVIDRKSLIDGMDDEGGVQIMPDEFNGEIDFQDVRFTYPNSTGEIVLNHINLNIRASKKVAIVGINGCGKSTVLKLICKEYLPDSGFIKIDGVDIRDLNTKWLRSQISVVPQSADFFDDSIEANVRMGKITAAFPEIVAACQCSNAHSFIVALKDAYQTRIGTNGYKLTAGQEQRLAIARALLRNPKILLLDEPTTSLDPQSELVVMDTLNNISKDRTVILVTHRLHLVTGADHIFVMKRGRVTEKGIHANLVKNKGPYNQLASGDVDKPSTSARQYAPLRAFDASDITAIHYMKMFTSKSFLPNIYADLLSVDPVAIRCSSLLMKQVVISQGRSQLQNSIEMEEEDVHYDLELKDSINTEDSILSESECMFRNKPLKPHRDYKEVQLQIVKSEVEGLKDILNLNRFSFWQVFWFTTRSTYKIPLIIALICGCGIGLILPLFGVLFSEAIAVMSDASAIPQDWAWAKQLGEQNDYKWIIIGFAFLGLFAGIAACVQEIFISVASYNMINYVRKKLFTSFLKQDMSFFENPANSVAVMRDMLASSVLTLRYLLNGFYGNFIQCIVAVVIAVLISFFQYATNLTGYTFAIGLGVAVINFIDGWLEKKQQLTTMQCLGEISELILQVFSGKQQVTTMQLEPFFLDKFNTIQIEAVRLRRRISYIRAFTFGLSQTAVFWGFTLFIYLSAIEIVHDRVSFQGVIAIGEMLLFGTITFGMNFSILPSFRLSTRAGESILNVLNKAPIIPSHAGDDIEGECTGQLGFHEVHFWYPFSGENPMLKGVTFYIQPGKTVAFVGSSESGKTAYVDVIVKFFNVTSGVLTLDGKDIRDLNVVSLRQQMGYIDKQPQLFNRTVAENIAYGDNVNVVTMSRIVEVAKQLNMHNFFCSLPDGYETRLGGEVDRLSTAQKYRIMIARAMLRNPKILLIEEPSAGLDREGERLVHQSIEEARKGRTCIIIAHRLVTVQNADLIVVMNDGFEVEKGTHAELMKLKNSEYGKLWRSQNLLEDEGFANGKSWLGNAVSKVKVDVKPVLLPKPTPPPIPIPDVVQKLEEKPKPQETGWFGSWCTPSTDNS